MRTGAQRICTCIFHTGHFRDLHLEDMLQVGREELAETARFWEDWITLLKNEEGDVEARLLQEAVFVSGGVERPSPWQRKSAISIHLCIWPPWRHIISVANMNRLRKSQRQH